jgi:hypothetical protein
MQLLPNTMGVRLPVEVREALLGLGMSCNDAKTLVGMAKTADAFALQRMESAQAVAHTRQGADDIAVVAGRARNQAIMAFARISLRYAVYASSVAAAVSNSATPPMPSQDRLLPSMLANVFERLLPEVRFAGQGTDAAIAEEHNADLAARRAALQQVISRWATSEAEDYDDLGVDVSMDVNDQLPELLHEYGAELVWTLGYFSGIEDESGEL